MHLKLNPSLVLFIKSAKNIKDWKNTHTIRTALYDYARYCFNQIDK